jgi:hypothetical protein
VQVTIIGRSPQSGAAVDSSERRRAFVADQLHRVAAYAAAVFMDLVILDGDDFKPCFSRSRLVFCAVPFMITRRGSMVMALVG